MASNYDSDSGGISSVTLLIIGGILVAMGVLVCAGLGYFFSGASFERERDRAERAEMEARVAMQRAQTDAARAQALAEQQEAKKDFENPLVENPEKTVNLQALESGQKAAAEFVELLKADKWKQAYEKTTLNFQRRMSPEDLQLWIQSIPGGGGAAGFGGPPPAPVVGPLPKKIELMAIRSGPGVQRWTYRLSDPDDGRLYFMILTVKQEEGVWKVDVAETANSDVLVMPGGN